MVVGAKLGDEWSRAVFGGPDIVDATPSNPRGLLGLVSRQRVLLVLYRLAQHASEDGVCFPGVDRLAEALGMSRRGVQAALAYLRVVGIVGRARRRSRGGRWGSTLTLIRRHVREVTEGFLRGRQHRRAELLAQKAKRLQWDTRRREAIVATEVVTVVRDALDHAQVAAPKETTLEYLLDHLAGQGHLWPGAAEDRAALILAESRIRAEHTGIVARISALRARRGIKIE